jgi:hypothetical protein
MARPSTVHVSTGKITLPTRLPAAPDKNPMFLEKRVTRAAAEEFIRSLSLIAFQKQKPIAAGKPSGWRTGSCAS